MSTVHRGLSQGVAQRVELFTLGYLDIVLGNRRSPVSDIEQLKRLIRAQHACIRIVSDDEPGAYEIVREAGQALGFEVLVWSLLDGVRDGVVSGAPAQGGTENPAAAMVWLAQVQNPTLVVMLDLAEHLSDARTLRAFREAVERFRQYGHCLVMIDHQETVPPVVAATAARLRPGLPDDKVIESTIRATLRSRHEQEPISVDMTKGGLKSIVTHLRGLGVRQIRDIVLEAVSDDRAFDANDLAGIVQSKRRMLENAGLLEFVDAPASMDEIGGLNGLKAWLAARTKSLSDKARDFGISPPRGVLLLGVQGAGKSLCAKAVATAWKRPLLRLDPGVLYDRYVGESEKRLRDALRQADAMAPVVLWIDEIEKAFASAASHSTDGGLSQRMFGSLLTWMQERESPVFVVATANNIEALPPELLRKGRFDETFFVDLPGAEARKEIFKIHLRKRGRDPAKFDLGALAAAAEGYSGAEIEQAILGALHGAFEAGRDIDTKAVVGALEKSPPLSVTMAESVETLRGWARGRCVDAG